jgi:hypothetical protein
MLFNKSTGKPSADVKDIMSTESLVAWLETQPVDKTYEYSNDYRPCLQAQYFAAMGRPTRLLGNVRVVFEGESGGHDIPHAFHLVAYSAPRTFGAALERAKTFLK